MDKELLQPFTSTNYASCLIFLPTICDEVRAEMEDIGILGNYFESQRYTKKLRKEKNGSKNWKVKNLKQKGRSTVFSSK